MKYDLKNMTIEEIDALCSELGMEAYRAKQISQWVFRHRVKSIDEMTTLSKKIRIKLHDAAYISSYPVETVAVSADGSKKFLFKTEDGFEQPWLEMDYILGGTPVLIRGGTLLTDFTSEKVSQSFVETRHPRTAVGVRADGWWVVLVVDGRRPNLSVGMTVKELGEYLLSLGCLDALNLDGGGSSTMVVRGKVVNSPSDINGERAVSDAVLFRGR